MLFGFVPTNFASWLASALATRATGGKEVVDGFKWGDPGVSRAMNSSVVYANMAQTKACRASARGGLESAQTGSGGRFAGHFTRTGAKPRASGTGSATIQLVCALSGRTGIDAGLVLTANGSGWQCVRSTGKKG